jgi:hypothetical protein
VESFVVLNKIEKKSSAACDELAALMDGNLINAKDEMKYRLVITIFVLCTALVLAACAAFPLLVPPTSVSSPTPEPGNPVLSTDDVKTRIKITPGMIFTLKRSACFGTCPVYSVTIFGDGKVVYEGVHFVPTVGRIEKQIPEDQLKQITRALEKANFYAFYQNRYRDEIIDASNLYIGIRTDKDSHAIQDGGRCSLTHTPGKYEFCDLGNQIDEILGMPW